VNCFLKLDPEWQGECTSGKIKQGYDDGNFCPCNFP